MEMIFSLGLNNEEEGSNVYLANTSEYLGDKQFE
jgi:hypothetical protein